MKPEELKEELSKVHNKLDTISVTIQSIDKTSALNTLVLKEHIKRTELNEVRIKSLEYWIIGLLTSGILVALASVLRH